MGEVLSNLSIDNKSLFTMKLQALKFKSILKSVIWGGDALCRYKSLEQPCQSIGESWEVSGFGQDISVIAAGHFEGKSLLEMLSTYPAELIGSSHSYVINDIFPLLIKFIGAHDDLSVQVHPNDSQAKAMGFTCGKTEMWYIVSAEQGATLHAGFTHEVTLDNFDQLVQSGEVLQYLRKYNVKAHDVFYLPAGVVHSIGKGMIVAEIQQSSDLTFRMFDYNRVDQTGQKRMLHTLEAKQAIDMDLNLQPCQAVYNKEERGIVTLVESSYFKVNRLLNTGCIIRDLSNLDSFVIFLWISGKGAIQDETGYTIAMSAGESIMIPACHNSVTIDASIESVILEVSLT